MNETHQRFDRNVFLLLSSAILSVVFTSGGEGLTGRFALGVLFSLLLWIRAAPTRSRWVALAVLWAGLAVPLLWPIS